MREELLKVAREKASIKICLAVIEEGVLDELQDLASEVLDEEKAERDAKLQQLASQVVRSRTAWYFKRYCELIIIVIMITRNFILKMMTEQHHGKIKL